MINALLHSRRALDSQFPVGYFNLEEDGITHWTKRTNVLICEYHCTAPKKSRPEIVLRGQDYLVCSNCQIDWIRQFPAFIQSFEKKNIGKFNNIYTYYNWLTETKYFRIKQSKGKNRIPCCINVELVSNFYFHYIFTVVRRNVLSLTSIYSLLPNLYFVYGVMHT